MSHESVCSVYSDCRVKHGFLDWLNPFVSFAETGVVIVKGRHNLTGFNLTATTARDHAFEFALQCSELFKPPANILELIFGNRFDD
tara:strand:- start:129 stop:386 length:258 start_codon:yes stop_codon:yes gene_type:complete